jgi:hypothetical protein
MRKPLVFLSCPFTPDPIRSILLTVMKRLKRPQLVIGLIIGLVLVAVLVAVGVRFALNNPESAQHVLGIQPTATLIVFDATSTPDRRATFPPTWTPSQTPSALPTATANATPTTTATPTITTTPVPSPTKTPRPTIPPGWTAVTVEEAGCSINLPNTWSTVFLTNKDPDSLLDSFTAQDVLLGASMAHGAKQINDLDRLFMIAFDTATNEEADLYVVNLNVAAANPADGETIDAIRDSHLQRYDSDPAIDLSANDHTRIDYRDVHRIRYANTFESDKGSTTVYHLEVIAEPRRGPILIITLSTSEERRNVYEALLDRIVTTIQFMR